MTVRVHHLSWVSMKGEAKRDYPASIHYQSPWWKDYAVVEDHFARVNTAMTRGKPVIRVGVIHPIESYWLYFGPGQQTAGIRAQLDNNFQNVTKWLLEGNIDFDYISESLLPEQCVEGSAPLQVGEMAYDAIVVPACVTLRSTTLERLEAFHAAGGKLVFLGDAPVYENAELSDRGAQLWKQAQRADISQEAVLNALEDVRMVDIRWDNGVRTNDLLHQLRVDGEDRWLFIAHSRTPYENDIPVKKTIRITLDGEYSVTLYDTQNGKTYSVPSRIEQGKTVLDHVIYDMDSLLLHYTKAASQAAPYIAGEIEGTQLPVGKLVSYSLDEPNVYLLDKAETALDDDPFRPEQELLMADNDLRLSLGWPIRKNHVVQPWAIHEPVPEHTVRLRFTVVCDRDIADVKLALEDADIAEIRLNGDLITAKADGWFTDKSIEKVFLGDLNEGENIIEVKLPFGQRTNVEWCYLLGDFGVRICGDHRYLTKRQEKLGFDDIVHQTLPHYGGNVCYEIPVTTKGGDLKVTVPHYTGTGVRVELDDQKSYILYPPYTTVLTDVPAGAHTLKLVLLGNRANCFGPVHLSDPQDHWLGNIAWRHYGRKWTDSYRLKTIGIRSAPIIEEL